MASYTYSPVTGLKTSESIYMLTADGWTSGVVEPDSDSDYTLTTDFTYDLADNVLTRTETCELGNGDQVTLFSPPAVTTPAAASPARPSA